MNAEEIREGIAFALWQQGHYPHEVTRAEYDDIRAYVVEGARQSSPQVERVATALRQADAVLASAAIAEIRSESWDEGARWGAVEFQASLRQIKSERQVELVPEDNPYRSTPASSGSDS